MIQNLFLKRILALPHGIPVPLVWAGRGLHSDGACLNWRNSDSGKAKESLYQRAFRTKCCSTSLISLSSSNRPQRVIHMASFCPVSVYKSGPVRPMPGWAEKQFLAPDFIPGSNRE